MFVGQTGSGKTTLARVLLAAKPYVVVHDGKGMINWKGYKLIRKMRQLLSLNPLQYRRIIYRPDVVEARSEVTTNAFFQWVYERRFTTLYVDEVYTLLERNGLVPPGYQACITRGRERGVETWSATQRPFRIPLIVLSESEHFYIFRLQVHEDRRRMEETSGLSEENIAALQKRWFHYVNAEDGAYGPYTLNFS